MRNKVVYTNKSLVKALTIIDLLDDHIQRLSEKEMADKLGSTSSAAYPRLSIFEKYG